MNSQGKEYIWIARVIQIFRIQCLLQTTWLPITVQLPQPNGNINTRSEGRQFHPRTKELPLQNLRACVCTHRILGLLKGNAFTAYADVIISLHFLNVNGIAASSIPQDAGLTQKNCTLTKVKFHTSGIVCYNSFVRRSILYSHYEEKQLKIFNLGVSKYCHTSVKTELTYFDNVIVSLTPYALKGD